MFLIKEKACNGLSKESTPFLIQDIRFNESILNQVLFSKLLPGSFIKQVLLI